MKRWYASGGGHTSGPHVTEAEAREHMRQIVETDEEFTRRLHGWRESERQRIKWALAEWIVERVNAAIDCGALRVSIDIGEPTPRPTRRTEFPDDLKVWSE